MSDFLNEVRQDCTEAETDLGGRTMVWLGKTYPVAPTVVRRGRTLIVGGHEVDITATLRVRWEGTNSAGTAWEFTAEAMPRSGDLLNYGGKTYRIAQVNDGHQSFLEILLMDTNR